ncbi:MAG: hypothetical protein RJB26_1224, partial [Pseudomonadota bacterium]
MSIEQSTTPVRAGFELDTAALLQWLRVHVPEFAGANTLELRQFRGGQSNPTYSITVDGRHYVLRKKPPGQLLPGAHAVDREY